MSILETLLKDPAILKGAMNAIGFDPSGLVGSVNRFAQAVSNISDKIDPPKPAETSAAVPAVPVAPKAVPMPREGFVIDHTGAEVALADIVAAINLAKEPVQTELLPVTPKGDCVNCALAHPITKLPTPAICGPCEKDMGRPKFVQRP